MRIIIMMFVLWCSVLNATADITVHIYEGVDDAVVRGKIEQTLTSILNEINNAQSSNRNLKFSNIGNIAFDVQKSMARLWENSPFVCTKEVIEERGIINGTGYQVRNIPLMMKPDAQTNFNEEYYQEAAAEFNSAGEIEGFHLILSTQLYNNVIKENLKVKDLRRRQQILNYVEQFRTAYDLKDMNFLEDIFSDDALIITGKVVKRSTPDGIALPDKIEYVKHTKRQYLTRLSAVFAANKRIRVTFDEIEVIKHPIDGDLFGVTLHQGYSSDNYHDDGYLFLLWDFKDENNPKIHVRTWQPDPFNKTQNKSQRLPKNEVFSVYDFDIE